MKVADTSFMIACLNASDPRQAKARSDLKAARPLVVPTEILVETLGVLKAKSGQAAARQALTALLAIPNIEWQECCNFPASTAIYTEERGLSLPDAIVVQTCVERNAPCLTFDERQAKAVRKRIPA